MKTITLISTLCLVLIVADKSHGVFGSKKTALSGQKKYREDPCSKAKCSTGRECVLRDDQASCQCIGKCAENSDMRRRVCSNMNDTWQSDCHMFRHKCLCQEELSNDCADGHKTMKIDYYGECQELSFCTNDILEDFPRRMREWLTQVMRTRMDKPLDTGMTASLYSDDAVVSRWIDAVIWKFCDLDSKPVHRTVSADELFPLRAPFLSMEPCIGKFLYEDCDPNQDRKVTFLEWSQCLKVPPGEMQDRCSEFVRLSSSGTSSNED